MSLLPFLRVEHDDLRECAAGMNRLSGFPATSERMMVAARSDRYTVTGVGGLYRAFSLLIHPLVVGAVIAAWALCRDLPIGIYGEELWAYWNRVAAMDPLTFLLTPSAGYFQLAARAEVLLAYPSPVVLRLMSSLVIGAFAAFLVSSDAIPSRAVRLLLAASIVVLPVQPALIQALNSQWWIALAVLLVALSEPRRWHPWFLAFAGLGAMPSLFVLPVFRDRRALPLLAAGVAQGLMFLVTPRLSLNPIEIPDSWWPILAGTFAVLLAPLPLRTRMGFLWLGLAFLVLGTMRLPTHGEARYLIVAWFAIALAATSIGWAILRWIGSHLDLGDVGRGVRAEPEGPALDRARA